MRLEETNKKKCVTAATGSSDEASQRTLTEAISRALGSKVHGLAVTCKNGDVTLKGNVDEKAQIAQMTAIAERAKGVKSVENRMTASPADKPAAKAAPASKSTATATPVTGKKSGHAFGTKGGGSGCG
jgi:hypothetical protein